MGFEFRYSNFEFTQFMAKILFIEDEAALQSAVGKILTDEGYQIISALDGEIGLRLAQDELPDLILLDCILPRKNGFEVLAELKKDLKTSGIPVIILSNLEGSEDIQRMIELGATTYLVKTNYRLEEIMKKIKDTLK
ncbi:MAG: Sensory transduction histidine kinase [Parcubacteria group bacterium GW2011_GWA2_45_30]|nr:MAG: Sensory transduction histidine kinase [Parcubacteria group bacterium GW2011_GWA2_45_30]